MCALHSHRLQSLRDLEIRDNLAHSYRDIFTDKVLDALRLLARFGPEQRELMRRRIERRAERARERRKIAFLDPPM